MTEYRDMSDLTAQEINTKLVELADRYPNRVYERPDPARWASTGCKYMHGDEPGCIFGHAFHELGISPDVMREWDEYHRGIQAATEDVRQATYQDSNAWAEVQDDQDGRSTWSNAVDHIRTS